MIKLYPVKMEENLDHFVSDWTLQVDVLCRCCDILNNSCYEDIRRPKQRLVFSIRNCVDRYLRSNTLLH